MTKQNSSQFTWSWNCHFKQMHHGTWTRQKSGCQSYITDTSQGTMVCNNNQACIDWAAAIMNKGMKHINLKENYVHEAHHRSIPKITLIPGKINTSNLFSKELKDAAQFYQCWDSMMVLLINFECSGHVVPSHQQTGEHLPYYHIRSLLLLENRHWPTPCAAGLH